MVLQAPGRAHTHTQTRTAQTHRRINNKHLHKTQGQCTAQGQSRSTLPRNSHKRHLPQPLHDSRVAVGALCRPPPLTQTISRDQGIGEPAEHSTKAQETTQIVFTPVGLLDHLREKRLKQHRMQPPIDNVTLDTAGLTSTARQSHARTMRGTRADSTIAPISFAVNASVYDFWKSDFPLFWLASTFAEDVRMNMLCFAHLSPTLLTATCAFAALTLDPTAQSRT